MFSLLSSFRKPARDSLSHFIRAAERGEAGAQYRLGLFHEFGQGVPQDAAKAVAWYRRAAEQGHAPAQFNLGWCCANGIGVERNAHEALFWYRKAAGKGNAQAAEALRRLGQ